MFEMIREKYREMKSEQFLVIKLKALIVHKKDYEGWCLSGGCNSAVEHWWLKPRETDSQ